MRREHLFHVLRAASRIVNQQDVVVIGSQSILASFDEDELPDEAIASIEVDVTFLDDPDQRKADLVDGVLGEDSMFHATFGYYAQGVGLDVATLPSGWRDRLVVVEGASIEPARGLCLDPHDLAVAKLVAGRSKDLDFVGALLREGLMSIAVVHERIDELDVPMGVKRRTHTLADALMPR